MVTQFGYIEQIIDEVTEPGKPIELVFVDWASESQHMHGEAPLRGATDYPVLQSPFWNDPGSFQEVWCEVEPDNYFHTCKEAIFALDDKNYVTGRFNWEPSPGADYLDLADSKVYEQAKTVISSSIL